MKCKAFSLQDIMQSFPKCQFMNEIYSLLPEVFLPVNSMTVKYGAVFPDVDWGTTLIWYNVMEHLECQLLNKRMIRSSRSADQ